MLSRVVINFVTNKLANKLFLTKIKILCYFLLISKLFWDKS